MPPVAGASTVALTLLNSLGQVVRTQRAALPGTGAALVLNTEALATGVYSLRVQAGAATVVKRVVVE